MRTQEQWYSKTAFAPLWLKFTENNPYTTTCAWVLWCQVQGLGVHARSPATMRNALWIPMLHGCAKCSVNWVLTPFLPAVCVNGGAGLAIFLAKRIYEHRSALKAS